MSTTGKKKRLIVISSGSFPYGGASTNRLLSYLKPLVKMGVETDVFLLYKSKDQSPLSSLEEGEYESIKYKYVCFRKNRTSFFKFVLFFRSIFKVRAIVTEDIKKHSEYRNTTFLILIEDAFLLFMFTRLARKYKFKIFHEKNEFPFINQQSLFQRIRLQLYYSQLKKLDGIFTITQALKLFFEKYIEADKIMHIPMTVEPERFEIRKAETEYGEYIAYCGWMYGDKDGVPILMKAFDLFAQKNKNVNLVLIGDTSDREKFSLIESTYLNLVNKDRVFFTGKVERDQMPRLLVNAAVLALARPDNIQAKGGFPTKLGEYLATGNPVVVTGVGEIPDYLRHLDNAYIAKPNSVEDFAEVLELAFLDTDQAKRIGLRGKELVYDVFNNRIQANCLFRAFFE
ncbi:MAG: glycosyltransferase family 4 protein [Chitinophagaceae bacterium]|nr:glycosyltransferase family 4 protein [Chitinophagaceae bacterium]